MEEEGRERPTREPHCWRERGEDAAAPLSSPRRSERRGLGSSGRRPGESRCALIGPAPRGPASLAGGAVAGAVLAPWKPLETPPILPPAVLSAFLELLPAGTQLSHRFWVRAGKSRTKIPRHSSASPASKEKCFWVLRLSLKKVERHSNLTRNRGAPFMHTHPKAL